MIKNKKPKIINSKDLREFQKDKRVYEKKLMDLDIREIQTKYWFKYIPKGIAIVFTSGFSFIAILNYANNIPIPGEIKIANPVSASFISDIPECLLKLLRKPPP